MKGNKKLLIIILLVALLFTFLASTLMNISEIKVISKKRNSDITADEEEIKYQPATIFKYDTNTFNSLTYSLEDENHYNQGIYFNDGKNTVINGMVINNKGYNLWTKRSEGIENSNMPYPNIAAENLDANGNIVFNYPQAGIFDESTNNGKEVYTNVGIPFTNLGNGTYRMDSNVEDINFPDGIAQSNVNMVRNLNKNTYYRNSKEWQGFFPFNSVDGENAIYHFGLKTDINFYMTRDGLTQGENKEDIIFEFSGDDDLWVYIDGKLVIDLGGIHDPISAEINFATKEVNTYLGLKAEGASINKTENLTDILGKDLSENVTEKHTLSIFYLERGQGGSNCTIQYNMPQVITTSNLTVHHYLENTEESIAPDEEYEVAIGESYSTEPVSDDKYELVYTPENAEGIADTAEVIVTYYYKVRSFDIITSVDGTGGTISGAGETPYEEVEYGENSTKPIVITPDEGYVVDTITVNGNSIDFKPNDDKTVTLDSFENMTEDKYIVVKFAENNGKITVNYVDKETGLILDSETITGSYGDKYTTSPKKIKGYELIEEELPNNAEGKIGTENITITYYYRQLEDSTVADDDIPFTGETGMIIAGIAIITILIIGILFYRKDKDID